MTPPSRSLPTQPTDVWCVRTEGIVPTPALLTSLSDEEAARAARFALAADRRSYELCHAALRWILGQRLGEAPARLRFVTGPWGKPALDRPFAASGIEFNLSHTAGLGLIAVTRGRCVGVDVEAVRPVHEMLGVAARVLCMADRETLAALSVDQRPEAFWTLWTANEACLKALGLGLGAGYHPIRLDARARPVPRDGSLSLRLLELEHPFVGALAAQGMAPVMLSMRDFVFSTEA